MLRVAEAQWGYCLISAVVIGGLPLPGGSGRRGVTSTSVYNGDGLRMSHTVDGVPTSYTWDVMAGLPVILQDSLGNNYVYGLDLISRTDSAGVQEYYLYDGLGSTANLTDGSGAVTASYSYDVFGELRSGAPAATDRLFTGEQRDAGTGLYYLRARYYDPSTGRFLSQDPIAGSTLTPQSLNPYPYVQNNPVNWVDPRGLLSEGRRCNIAEAITGGLLSVLGAIAIGAPGVVALLSPGTQLGGLFLLEIAAIPVEAAAITLIIDSGCVH